MLTETVRNDAEFQEAVRRNEAQGRELVEVSAGILCGGSQTRLLFIQRQILNRLEPPKG